nr:unnamed protein product [Spirometra erinaceieuropaei]
MPIEVFAFLCIPAKTGYPIELDLLLEEFINIHYGPEAAATCKPDITVLHTLRNDILSHFSDDTKQTIRRIKQYLNLLMCLENRVPINDHGMLVNFTWSNCFLSHRTSTFFSSVFERCCMLFCLAVAYNEYGGLQPLDDSSSLEKAAKCYQKSASIFEHLRKECPPAYGCAGVWDLTSECLDAFAKILLAQTVEIQVMKASLEKADPRKIFELASHASHLYSAALAAVSDAPAKCRFPKAWSEHLEMKIKVTSIQAEHNASVVAVQKGKYEEQLARKYRVYKLILSINTPAYKERFHAAAINEMREIEALEKEHQVNMDTVTAMEASLTLKETTDLCQFDQIQFVFSEKHQTSNAFRYLQAMPRLELLPEEAYEPVITSEMDKLRGLTHTCNHCNNISFHIGKDVLRFGIFRAEDVNKTFSEDNSQTDDQLEESADNTRGSMPEDDAEQSSFKGFKRRRSVLSSVEEQVVFPVKNLRLAGAANDHNLSTPGDVQGSILTTYHLPTTGFPYRAGFLIPCRAYSDGASQCLLNLLITGRSSPHLFDGERTLSGFTMQGVIAQPKTGFLTVVEALRYCEVGWYLKNPSTPVWILGSETHFTVLASDNTDLVSVEEPLPTPGDPLSTSGRPRANLRQAEREFTTLTENTDSGFLSYEQFEVLLDLLGLPVDQQSISTAKNAIDSEGLGIILREPFLAYYYAEELQRESSPVSSFRLVHYNGLAASNSNGGIRYRYGEANLLDPVDDTNPTGGTPLDRCLKTKWPTIRVMWSNEPAPSLN